MNTILGQLLKLEWHERKWAFALAIGWVGVNLVYAVGYELAFRLRAPVASFNHIGFMLIFFASIFLAMRTALGERTQRTLSFSTSLPVSMRLRAFLRMASGAAVLVVPILIGATTLATILSMGVLEQAPPRAFDDLSYVPMPQRAALSATEACQMVWTVTIVSVAVGMELYLILSLLGTFVRSERSLGFFGACVIGFWFLLQSGPAGSDYWFGALFPHSLIVSYGYGTMEGTSYSDIKINPHHSHLLVANLGLLLVLAGWFTLRYGQQVPVSPSRRWPLPDPLSWLAFRWPSRWGSLVWCDLRRAVPMTLAGLVIAILMVSWTDMPGGLQQSGPVLTIMHNLVNGTVPVGIFWGAVVGAGIFAADLMPRNESFWRSRPITAAEWFWLKYVIGLVAVVGCLDLLPIWLRWILLRWVAPELSSYVDLSDSSDPFLLCMPLLHATIYSLAVWAVCTWRRPVVAAIAAMSCLFLVEGILGSLPTLGQFTPFGVFNRFNDATQPHWGPLPRNYWLVYGTLAAVNVVAAWRAWRTVAR